MAADRAAFSISGAKTRSDWENLVPILWYRPDLRDSVPPVLQLPNGDTTISPVRMWLNVLAAYDELDYQAGNLYAQGFWSVEQHELALKSNDAGRCAARKSLISAQAWEALRRQRRDV